MCRRFIKLFIYKTFASCWNLLVAWLQHLIVLAWILGFLQGWGLWLSTNEFRSTPQPQPHLLKNCTMNVLLLHLALIQSLLIQSLLIQMIWIALHPPGLTTCLGLRLKPWFWNVQTRTSWPLEVATFSVCGSDFIKIFVPKLLWYMFLLVPTLLSTYSTYLPTYLSNLPTYPTYPTYLLTYLPTYLPTYLYTNRA